MSDRRQVLTFKAEFSSVEEVEWLWNSMRDFILNGKKAVPVNGLVITNVFDDDIAKRNRELEEKLSKYEAEYGPLEGPEIDDD